MDATSITEISFGPVAESGSDNEENEEAVYLFGRWDRTRRGGS